MSHLSVKLIYLRQREGDDDIMIDSNNEKFQSNILFKSSRIDSLVLSIEKVGRVDRRLSGHGAGLEKVKSVGSAD